MRIIKIILMLISLSMAKSLDDLPIKVFVSSHDEKFGVISEREQIKYVMDYIRRQDDSFCLAEFSATAYFKNDSSITYPIWISCCKEKSDSIKKYIDRLISNEKNYRRYEFNLPIDNDPKHIIDLFIRSQSFIYKLDTTRSQSIKLYASEDRVSNRQEYWNSFINETNINSLYNKFEIETSEFRLFSAKLYFDDIVKFAEAYNVIKNNGRFQIHQAIVPSMNEYGVFVEFSTSKLDSLLKGKEIIRVKIGE